MSEIHWSCPGSLCEVKDLGLLIQQFEMGSKVGVMTVRVVRMGLENWMGMRM